jgi:hypothetical protein
MCAQRTRFFNEPWRSLSPSFSRPESVEDGSKLLLPSLMRDGSTERLDCKRRVKNELCYVRAKDQVFQRTVAIAVAEFLAA